MFKEEAKLRSKEWFSNNVNTSNYKTPFTERYCYELGFKDGAEFGYNKVNKWYYPSKGEYPKENKRYLCEIKAFVGGGITYECFDYNTEYNYWEYARGDVIAWKELVPPKE